ncbi:MAG: LCP family protein [Actinomycetota bacterium]|nr:LCP family protein [Actinomycetota bacterium]
MPLVPPVSADGPQIARRAVAGLLSMIVPGAGHAFAGAWRRGVVLFALFALAAVLVIVVAALPVETAAWLLEGRLLLAALAVNIFLFALRLFAALDAWRIGALAESVPALVAAGAIGVLTAAPHFALGYVTVRSEVTLQRLFADEEPSDVLPARGVFLRGAELRELPRAAPLPTGRLFAARDVLVSADTPLERPWVTILLLGSDEGPGQPGDRTDTMILVGLERDTGRAVAFGIPRNLVGVRLVGRAGDELRRFPDLLNALYRFANEERPDLFPGGRDPGATALKQTISRLLGLRVDYHAMVDLDGFRDLVDELGGVKIRVRERIADEVTRPAWGETKPRINVYPGRTYHFDGRTALAYVRSRKDSDDYNRMHRQRCFLTAIANQLDVVSVLRNFGALVSIVESSVRTDIPRDQLPDLIRLIGRLDPNRTITVTFGRRYIARRRAGDRFPIPNVRAMRATAREAILQLRPHARRDVETVRRAC